MLANEFVNSITGDCTITYKFGALQAKLIEYAYPSSTTATQAGYGKTGCWFVCIYESVNSCKKVDDIAYFADKEQAEAYAELLPNPYNFMHKYHHL